MTLTALIPAAGIDRPIRTAGAGAEQGSPAGPDSDSGPGAVARDTTVVGGQAATDLTGGTRSGLGDGARSGLLQSAGVPDGEATSPDGLTEEEQAVVRDMAARDREVRNHEEAHARVGGQYAGQPSYTFATGPDGNAYAVAGEVPIDVAPIPDDPKATIVKMDIVVAAALAPAEPSGQDRKVAALAARQRVEAMADLNAERQEEVFAALDGDTGRGTTGSEAPQLSIAIDAVNAAGFEPAFDRAA